MLKDLLHTSADTLLLALLFKFYAVSAHPHAHAASALL